MQGSETFGVESVISTALPSDGHLLLFTAKQITENSMILKVLVWWPESIIRFILWMPGAVLTQCQLILKRLTSIFWYRRRTNAWKVFPDFHLLFVK